MDIKYYLENTELTQLQIANKLGISIAKVHKYSKHHYTREERLLRKSICYRNSKIGTLNPTYGKPSHNLKGDVGDCKGYHMRWKPSWYTGRKNSTHVFTHHIVVCENLGLTEIPKGWVVHHCNFVKTDNSFDNLVLLLMGDHTKLHKYLDGVTTISKESTLKWVETYGTPWCRDIVSSTQECVAAKAV